MKRMWTKEEISILKYTYRDESDVKRLAKLLSRTESSIKHKASRLRIKVRTGRAKIRNHHGKPYWYIIKNRKAVFVHDVLMKKVLGRKLKSNEIVHHKDGNGLNNRRSNLEVMTRSEHMLLHSYDRERDSKGQFC